MQDYHKGIMAIPSVDFSKVQEACTKRRKVEAEYKCLIIEEYPEGAYIFELRRPLTPFERETLEACQGKSPRDMGDTDFYINVANMLLHKDLFEDVWNAKEPFDPNDPDYTERMYHHISQIPVEQRETLAADVIYLNDPKNGVFKGPTGPYTEMFFFSESD